MIAWTKTTYLSATDAEYAYSGTPVADIAEWAYEVADFIKGNIDDIEDFACAHEERDHFNFLFKNMFKERLCVRSMLFYRRLMFFSGWLGRKARAKKA